jgi:error-prone DNA polymerase
MYAELAVTSNFSFLRGASHPEELVARAKRLGLAGIGIADRNSVAGVVRVHVAAQEAGLKLAVGARLVFADGTPDILAYPRDRAAWGRLTRLLSLGKRRAEKGDCILHIADLIDFSAGLNLLVMPPPPHPRHCEARRAEAIQGSVQGGLDCFAASRLAMTTNAAAMQALLARLKETGSANCVWLAASMLYRGDDARRLARLAETAETAAVPLIAINDVLYHSARRRALQDILTCIREHTTIDAAGRRLEANAERHLKPAAEMARLFRRHPEAIRQTVAFLDGCGFSLDELKHTEYPDETRKGYATPQDALVAFAEAGAQRRYPGGIPPKVRHALSEELRLIGELKYAPFFLTVHDIVQFARDQAKILCQGRGSAANSVICYCLGITDVDPLAIDLLFERFVSAERNEPPDIDVDFEHERREEVIQHIYRTYTRERAGLAATVICYRGRSAIRDVGKVFGLSEDTIGALAGSLWGWSMEGVTAREARRLGLDPSDRRLKMARSFARVLMGFPRHLSQHVGGFVITRSRLDEVVPIENAAMEDRTVIEWDKTDLDAMGLLKVDVLGLGMLSCLRRGFALLQAHYGEARDLSIQDEDAAVYRMIQRADTIGVFQIESRAQMSMLPRLRPAKFYDLVIEVAIVRPGPIQGDMVHPYLRRRQKLEPVSYPSPELEAILHKTLGVPLFQEHAMRIAIVAAGFAPAEADKLRRAMATFKRVGTIKYFRDKFINGMTSRGYPADFAARCFSQIEGFGEYGFPESHAASFANLVYASAWIKCRYPDVFACALLNSQPMGFYAAAQIVRDAQEHGVEVRAVDINHSSWDCSLEPPPYPPPLAGEGREGARERLHPRHAEMRADIRTAYALRLGFRQISGCSEADGRQIESVRGAGFDSVRDFWLRTGLKPSAIERLAAADAFRSLGLDRRDALWAVRALQRSGDKDDLPLLKRVKMPELEPDAGLPPMLLGEQVVEDYRRLHLSLKAHPVAFLRADLARRGILRHEELPAIPSGRRVKVGGLVLVRQRPGTAAGVIFMTLEDETAIANTIVWPKIFETFRPVVLGARLISVTGKLQSESGVIHVVAERLEDLTALLRRLSQDHGCVESLARADAVKHSSPPDLRRHPRVGDTLVTLFRDEPALAGELGLTAEVMPKGRNFH